MPLVQGVRDNLIAQLRAREGVSAAYNALSSASQTFFDLEPDRKLLVAAGIFPETRKEFYRYMNASNPWRANRQLNNYEPVIVVGAGLHGAVAAALYEPLRAKRLVVVDDGAVPGGILAQSLSPAFYLNSRNRAGAVGLPDMGDALNTIPGSAIQPAFFNNLEYQTNDDYAWAILASHLLYSAVYRGREVVGIERTIYPSKGKYKVFFNNEDSITTDVLIFTTGLGTAVNTFPRAPEVRTFPQFLRTIFTASPEQPAQTVFGEKVAVFGASNSGDVAVEYLMGQGPQGFQISSAGLFDTVQKVYWFGQSCSSKEDFERNARSRYKRIGLNMPREGFPNIETRIQPFSGRGVILGRESRSTQSFRVQDENTGEEVIVDSVILCTGFENKTPRFIADQLGLDDPIGFYDTKARLVGKTFEDESIFLFGPCADLPITPEERRSIRVFQDADKLRKENSVAAFRYVDRTKAGIETLLLRSVI